MKKLTILIAIIFIFSCKEEKKSNANLDTIPETTKVEYNTVKSFIEGDLITWTKTRVDLQKSTTEESSGAVYNLSRASETESCFLSTSIVPVTNDNDYRASINVKKGAKSSVFGLRISGSYPDRVDTLFDLDKGQVIEVKTSRDFQNSNASIEDLGNGWYKCTVSAKVSAENIRIILGPSTSKKDVLGWEGKTEELGDINFVPSTLIVEEIIHSN